jgi:pimeloyl-ACP methyl ester carboxylesterase
MDTNVPVGSVSLHIVCRGEGEPVVVLDSGLGNDAQVWSAVQTDVAQTTTVCAYDRAGLGASSAAPRPHTNLMMAEELRDLLRNAKLPSPYVLVGHSMGGVNVRLLSQAHPNAVAGMVLVDSMSESQLTEFWPLIPDADMEKFRTGIRKLPEGTDFETLSKGLSEVGMAKTISAKPLVVLSRDLEDAPPGAGPDTAVRLRLAWQKMQEKLSHLSTNRAYVVVKGAHHVIQREQPQVVAAAIREVVRAVREHRSVDDSVIRSALK